MNAELPLNILSIVIALVSLVGSILSAAGVYYNLRQKVDRNSDKGGELETRIEKIEISQEQKLDQILKELHEMKLILARNQLE